MQTDLKVRSKGLAANTGQGRTFPVVPLASLPCCKQLPPPQPLWKGSFKALSSEHADRAQVTSSFTGVGDRVSCEGLRAVKQQAGKP